MAQSQPYEYPTPEMLAGNVAGLRSLSSLSPLSQGLAIDTSNLGAPSATPTQRRLGARVAAAFRYVILGADSGQVLFAPQQPLQPTSQDPAAAAVGRPYDYPVGYNTRVTPRTGVPIGFSTLKSLADGYDVLRILIERVKDKVVNEEWSVMPKKKGAVRDARCDMLDDFFTSPDKRHSWTDWSRMLLEQVIVYDAPAIWLRPDRGGDLYGLEILDGALVTPKITPDGRTPAWDEGPAYQQILHGLPAVDYIAPVPFAMRAQTPKILGAADGWPMPELLYKPRNPRVDSPYGMGPVEQIITTINIALSREAYLQGYYTQGSTPDLLMSVPKEWQPDQIRNFQLWWDSVQVGNLTNRRGARFVPDGLKVIDTKEKALADEVDQWLIRIMCFNLGLNPMPFIKQMNRGQEKTHHQEAQEEGQAVWKSWLASVMDTIISVKFGFNDLTFMWEEQEASDPLEQAQIAQIYIQCGVLHPDELRERNGDGPMPAKMRAQMDMATFNPMAVNATQLPPDQQAAQQKQALELQAAKPAPVMPGAGVDKPAASADKPPEKMAWAEFFKAMQQPAPTIHVDAPVINLPTINVAPAPVTVNMPEIKQADVFVDVGPTNIKIEAAKHVGIGKTVTAVRGADGKMVGTISDGIAKTVTAERAADGKLVAKIEG